MYQRNDWYRTLHYRFKKTSAMSPALLWLSTLSCVTSAQSTGQRSTNRLRLKSEVRSTRTALTSVQQRASMKVQKLTMCWELITLKHKRTSLSLIQHTKKMIYRRKVKVRVLSMREQELKKFWLKGSWTILLTTYIQAAIVYRNAHNLTSYYTWGLVFVLFHKCTFHLLVSAL